MAIASEATHDADASITGINVTPLVDITLVLLIIFMVTAKIAVETGRSAVAYRSRTSPRTV